MNDKVSTSLLDVRTLSVRIGGVQVVEQLSLSVKNGEFWGVLGPNGIGKTTLLNTLAGLHPPSSGEVFLDQENVFKQQRRKVAQKLGMLMQNTRYAFEASCEETALVGRHPYLNPWSTESDADRNLARQALDDVGLLDIADRSCMQLSGGESRRLALATLLVQDPEVYLLDEPTNHLDPANQVAMLNVLAQRIRDKGKAAFMALHEVNLATCYCSHVVLLFGKGRWLAGPTDELLNEENLSALYRCRVRLVDDGLHRVFAVAGQPAA